MNIIIDVGNCRVGIVYTKFKLFRGVIYIGKFLEKNLE